MTDAVRRVLSSAGVDPRRVDLCAFGGMGTLHATAQAAALGVRRVLVPRAAPGFSALGLVSADHRVDISRGLIADWREVDIEQLDVLAHLMQGKNNKVICRVLGLAEPTVKNHVTAILRALKVTNRTEAVIAVNELGWKLPASPKS